MEDQMSIVNVNGKEGNWGGNGPVPEIGQRVKILFNGLGNGTVVNLIIVDGYVGAQIKLDNNPDWRKKNLAKHNFPEYTPALAFGPEIEILP